MESYIQELHEAFEQFVTQYQGFSPEQINELEYIVGQTTMILRDSGRLRANPRLLRVAKKSTTTLIEIFSDPRSFLKKLPKEHR